MPLPKAKPLPILAVVGSDTLLGQEMRELLSNQRLATQVRLIASEIQATSVLSAEDEEPVLLTPLSADSLSGVTIAFLCGSQKLTKDTLELTRQAKRKPVLIDLTGALENLPGALVRAPMAEPEIYLAPESPVCVIAHPAAIALAMLLRLLPEFKRSVVQAFEPASALGKAGVEEMQHQTMNLLSFKPMPEEVFDAQASFNILTAYGEDSPHSLADSESRVVRNLKALPGEWPRPSVRLVHAPVFHATTASVWVEFARENAPGELLNALKAPYLDVRDANVEPPTNIGAAGQSGIIVGDIRVDAQDARAVWFFVAADNLKLPAENALMVATEILVEAARGVQ